MWAEVRDRDARLCLKSSWLIPRVHSQTTARDPEISGLPTTHPTRDNARDQHGRTPGFRLRGAWVARDGERMTPPLSCDDGACRRDICAGRPCRYAAAPVLPPHSSRFPGSRLVIVAGVLTVVVKLLFH